MSSRKERRTKRRRQLKINTKLKKKLFGDKVFAPCIYCKQIFWMDKLTIEHLTPLSFGGGNDPSNVALACGPCNNAKGRESWLLKGAIMKEMYGKYTS